MSSNNQTTTSATTYKYPVHVRLMSVLLTLLDSALFAIQLVFSYSLYILFLGEKPRKDYLYPSSNCSPAVVVSGASSGLGMEISKNLCSQGYTVFAGYRNEADREELVQIGKAFSNKQGSIKPVKLDVSNSAHIRGCFSEVNDYINMTPNSVLAGVVCNAGVISLIGLAVCNRQLAEKDFAVNYFGALELAQTFIPLLKITKGRIIFIGSVASKALNKAFGVYTATKAALRQTSLLLNSELYELGIKVVLLEPGLFRTRALETITNQIDETKQNKRFSGLNSISKGIEVDEKDEEIRGVNRGHLVKTLKLIGLSSCLALPPDNVVDHVAFALRAPFVKSNYTIGWDGYFVACLSFLPEFLANIIRRYS